MITCTLGEKKYCVTTVKARVMREIEPAVKMLEKLKRYGTQAEEGVIPEVDITTSQAMDVLTEWFCLLFDNQFTPEDVYDNYPADSWMHDITFAIMAVQNQMTKVLNEFPMKPATEPKTKG